VPRQKLQVGEAKRAETADGQRPGRVRAGAGQWAERGVRRWVRRVCVTDWVGGWVGGWWVDTSFGGWGGEKSDG
jgi:hypothetical protein